MLMRIGVVAASAILLGQLWTGGALAQEQAVTNETLLEYSEENYVIPDPVECGPECSLDLGVLFRDCIECPVMKVLPRGVFMMGNPDYAMWEDDEVPHHRVELKDRIAMGIFEVTFAEWDACASDGFCRSNPHPHDEGWGRGDNPVVNVNWLDITDKYGFIGWLNSKVPGEPYRLPSEAEWEYAARAGTNSAFYTGGFINDQQANFRASIPFNGSATGEYRRRLVPVGSFPANPFGLHDMHGNAMEWVADCWHDTYGGAPSNGEAWLEENDGECDKRVLRGGSWLDAPETIRSASRIRYDSELRVRKNGFRVVRDLLPETRWVSFTGGYELDEGRANIAGVKYYHMEYSHPEDEADFYDKMRRHERNLMFESHGMEERKTPIGTFIPSKDIVVKSSTAIVENLPLEHHDFHLGDNCMYSDNAVEFGADYRLPGPGEIYCTGTSLWQGDSYSRTWSVPGDLGLYLPEGNYFGCSVDIALIQPDEFTEEDVKDVKVTCLLEYEIAQPERTVQKALRIPYLDQYPEAPDLIQPDRPWYQAWDSREPLVVRGFSAYFSPKPFRDQVVEDICIYAVNSQRQRIPGKELCMDDQIYDTGSNDLYIKPGFLEGTLVIEPGEYLSGSCRLVKGNNAADCAIYVLVDLPDDKRANATASPVYTNNGVVTQAYLRGDYCQKEIFDYPLTVNGRNTILRVAEGRAQPWRGIVRQNKIPKDDLTALCPYLFLDGLVPADALGAGEEQE